MYIRNFFDNVTCVGTVGESCFGEKIYLPLCKFYRNITQNNYKNEMKKLQIWLYLMVFGWQQLSAQDSSLQRSTEQYAAAYMDVASVHAALFSGNREQQFVQTLINHQYFKNQDFVNGRLSYNGIVYPDVSLRWDLYRDELIILSPANYAIVLKSENIDFAEIYGYHILYLYPDNLSGYPPAGNYIRLYSGSDYFLLEKLTNTMYRDENVQRNKFHYYFVLSSNFYLQKNGTYYKISNRKSLLKTLDTHRKELRRFIRSRDLSYKRDAEKMVLETVKEHEKLNRHE